MTTPARLKPFTPYNLYANVRGALILFPWLIHLFATDLALSALLPLSFLLPKTSYNVSSVLASLVWRGIQTIFTRANRARITRSGDKLPLRESAIVVANHVSWSDFYMIQQVAIDSGMLGRCRWFAKQQLKWVPFLGWGLWAMGMPLISRQWDKDQRELDRVFKGPKQYELPIWLISYSEATRYTPQKFLETVQWCKANKKPIPKYTLHPRTKGFVTTVKELRQSSSVKAIYDFTIAYAHERQFLEAPPIWETLSNPALSKEWKFHVHVKRFSLDGFEEMSDEEVASWLEQQWVAKGHTLEELQQELEEGQDWAKHVDTNYKKAQ